MPKTYISELAKGFYLLRVDDEKVKYFEGLWYIPEGISYNAYLMVSNEKTILFDGWKYSYEKEFLETLSKLVDPKKIDSIIIHHAEPDHSGTLAKLLEINGSKTEVYGHTLAKKMLEGFYKVKLNFKDVVDGQELDIAGNRLKFIYTALLHWPETIMTYIAQDGILLSGDAFGAYSMPEKLFDEDEETVLKYLPFAKKYLVTVIGHYREHIVKNIEKLDKLGLDIRLLVPLHGLVWKKNPRVIIDYYKRWAQAVPEKNKIVIIYSSMYGFVDKAVLMAAKELDQKGYKTLIYKFTDTNYAPISDILGEVIDAQGIILGTGVYEADLFPYMRHFIDLLIEKADSPRPILILSSYGWGNVVRKKIEERFKGSKFKLIDIIDFQGLPDGEVEYRIREGVKNFLNADFRGLHADGLG